MPLPFSQAGLDHVTLQLRDELPVLRIGNRHAEAWIALQGAQVLEYKRHGERPLLWTSEQARYRRGTSVRGGIPICWPWFGAAERNPAAVRAMTSSGSLPAHGLVRGRDWTLREIRELHDETAVTLGFVTDHIVHQLWPQAAELELTVGVGRSLRLALTTRNLGDRSIAITQALHTYLAVSAIDEIRLTGFDKARCIDTLDDWHEHSANGAIRFAGETDRIYLDVPAEMQLWDGGWQRTIRLRMQHSRSAVVWNPWVDKARQLSQFAPEAWRDMVCIETANVLDDAVILAPSQAHTIGVEIDCETGCETG